MNIYNIKKLKVTHFRLFDELNITFNKDINVIIADNGAGKTTILDAIAIGFGAMLTQFPNIKGITFKKSDLRMNYENKLEPFFLVPTRRRNAIKLSQGEHAGSPLQPRNTRNTLILVGADRRVCP